MRTRKLATRGAVLVLVGGAVLAPLVAQANDPPLTVKPPQREWMRTNGEDPGVWVPRKTITDANGNVVEVVPDTTRSLTHGDSGDPGVDCQSSCHKAGAELLRAPVSASGFTNAFGETPGYAGNQNPGELLANPANQTAHKKNWEAEGCKTCHGKSAAAERGLEEIEGCKSCHNFGIFALTGDPTKGNLHATHVPFVQAEQALANPEAGTGAACDYCHAETAEGGNGSCWNCHLSGHWPKVVYWRATPSLPAVPAVPAGSPAIPALTR